MRTAPGKRLGTTFPGLGRGQAASIWRTVGGSATPAACSARLAAARGAVRTRKRLPSCSTSVSASESRSKRISGHQKRLPRLAIRRRGPEMLGIGGDRRQRLGRGRKQHVVDRRLVLIGDVGDRELPHGGARRPCPALRGLRACADRRHRLQLAKAQVPDLGVAPSRPAGAEDIRDLQKGAGHGRGALSGRLAPFGEKAEPLERARHVAQRVDGDARPARRATSCAHCRYQSPSERRPRRRAVWFCRKFFLGDQTRDSTRLSGFTPRERRTASLDAICPSFAIAPFGSCA